MATYLVQHGKAVSKEADKNRPLSIEGRQETAVIADKLMSVNVTRICHSGKTRARETAEILAAKLANNQTCQISGMDPNDDVIAFSTKLKDNFMYVGHLPHLGNLVSFLTCGDESADVLQFVNSGVVCLEKTENSYHIRWFIVP